MVFIQDAHDSLEAQENIAKIINHLTTNYGVKTVFEEGYEGPVPTDEYFGSIQDAELRRKVSFFFLDHLRIGGAEYAHINRAAMPRDRDSYLVPRDSQKRTVQDEEQKQVPSPESRGTADDWQLIGADSLQLHRENVDQYRLSAERKERIDRDLKALEKEVRSLADARFPKEFKEWLKVKEQYDLKRLDLFTYLGRSMPLLGTRDSGLGTRSGPSFLRGASPEGLVPLLRFIIAATSSTDPAVIEKAKHIDAREVFAELSKLERSITEAWLHDATDLELYSHYRSLELLRRLNELQITQEEYEAIKGTLKAFNTQTLGTFIHRNVKKPLVLSKQWERNIREAVKFYEIAAERDGALSGAIDSFYKRGLGTRDSHLEQTNPESLEASPAPAVLVYGGFHKENIKRILEAKGISYIVVSPKITKPSRRHEAFYKRLMIEGSFPFEAALSPALATATRNPSLYSGMAAPAAQSEIRRVASIALRYPDQEGTWERYVTGPATSEESFQNVPVKWVANGTGGKTESAMEANPSALLGAGKTKKRLANPAESDIPYIREMRPVDEALSPIRIGEDLYQIASETSASIVMTDRCNGKCAFCINNTGSRLSGEAVARQFSQKIKKAIDVYHVKDVVLLGGEPLLAGHLSEVLSELDKVKDQLDEITVTTNGTPLRDKNILQLVGGSSISSVNISYHHYDKKRNDAIMGIETLTLEEIEALNRFLMSKGKTLRVNVTAFKGGIDNVPDLERFANSFGNQIDVIKLTPVYPTASYGTVDHVSEFTKGHSFSREEWTQLLDGISAKGKVLAVHEDVFGVIRTLVELPSRVKMLLVNPYTDKKEPAEIRSLKILSNGKMSLSWLGHGPDLMTATVEFPRIPTKGVDKGISLARSEARGAMARSVDPGMTRRQVLWGMMAAFVGMSASVPAALARKEPGVFENPFLKNAELAAAYEDTARGLVSLRINSMPVNQTPSPRVPAGAWLKSADIGYMLIADLLMMINHQDHPVSGFSKPELAGSRIRNSLKMMKRMTDDFELKVKVNGKDAGTGILPEVLLHRGNYFETELADIPGRPGLKGIPYALYDMGLTHERLKIIRDVFAGGIAEGVKDLEISHLAAQLLGRSNYRAFVDKENRIHAQVFQIPGTGEIVQGPLIVDNQHTEARFIVSIAELLGTPGKSEEERYREGMELWDRMWFKWRYFKMNDGEITPVAEGDYAESGWTLWEGAQFYDPEEAAPYTWGKSQDHYWLILEDLKKRHKLAWVPATGLGTGRAPFEFSEFGIGNYPDLPKVIVPAFQFAALAHGSDQSLTNAARFVRATQENGTYVRGWGLPDAVDPVSAKKFFNNNKILFINQGLTLEFLNYAALREMVRQTAWGQRAIRTFRQVDLRRPKSGHPFGAVERPALNLMRQIKGYGAFTQIKEFPANRARIAGSRLDIAYNVTGGNTFSGFFGELPGLDLSGYKFLAITFSKSSILPKRIKVEFKNGDHAVIAQSVDVPLSEAGGKTVNVDISRIAEESRFRGHEAAEMTLVIEAATAGESRQGQFQIEDLTLRSTPRSELRVFRDPSMKTNTTTYAMRHDRLDRYLDRWFGEKRGVSPLKQFAEIGLGLYANGERTKLGAPTFFEWLAHLFAASKSGRVAPDFMLAGFDNQKKPIIDAGRRLMLENKRVPGLEDHVALEPGGFADLEAYAAAEGGLDCIRMLNLLIHHRDHPEDFKQAFGYVSRALKPGGLFIEGNLNYYILYEKTQDSLRPLRLLVDVVKPESLTALEDKPQFREALVSVLGERFGELLRWVMTTGPSAPPEDQPVLPQENWKKEIGKNFPAFAEAVSITPEGLLEIDMTQNPVDFRTSRDSREARSELRGATKATKVTFIGVGSPGHYNMWNNLSLETLAGDLQGAFGDGVAMSTLWTNNSEEVDAIVKQAMAEEPNILGLSVQPGSMEIVTLLAEKLNNEPAVKSGKVLVVFGNQIPTYIPEKFIALCPQGVVVRGEGEASLRGLVRVAKGELKLSDIPSAVYKDRESGTIVHTPITMTPLNSLEYSPLNDSYDEIVKRGGNVQVQASRGCPWGGCAYCTRSSFRKGGLVFEKGKTASWEGFTVERVLKTLDDVMSRGIAEVEFSDDEFIGGRTDENIRRIRAIADGIEKLSKKHGIHFSFRIFLRPTTLYREGDPDGKNEVLRKLIFKLKRVGLARVFIGVEAGNESQLKRYTRGLKLSETTEAINILRAMGVGIDTGFIMFDPELTVDEMLENIRYFRTNHLIESNQWPFRPMAVNHGSRIVERLRREGLLGEENSNFMSYDYRFQDPAIEKIAGIVDAISIKTRTIFYALKVKSKIFDVRKKNVKSHLCQKYVEANGLIYLDLMEALGKAVQRGATQEVMDALTRSAEARTFDLARRVFVDIARGKIDDEDGYLKKELGKIGIQLPADAGIRPAPEIFEIWDELPAKPRALGLRRDQLNPSRKAKAGTPRPVLDVTRMRMIPGVGSRNLTALSDGIKSHFARANTGEGLLSQGRVSKSRPRSEVRKTEDGSSAPKSLSPNTVMTNLSSSRSETRVAPHAEPLIDNVKSAERAGLETFVFTEETGLQEIIRYVEDVVVSGPVAAETEVAIRTLKELRSKLELIRDGRLMGHPVCLGCANGGICPMVAALLRGKQGKEDKNCATAKRPTISEAEVGLALQTVDESLKTLLFTGAEIPQKGSNISSARSESRQPFQPTRLKTVGEGRSEVRVVLDRDVKLQKIAEALQTLGIARKEALAFSGQIKEKVKDLPPGARLSLTELQKVLGSVPLKKKQPADVFEYATTDTRAPPVVAGQKIPARHARLFMAAGAGIAILTAVFLVSYLHTNSYYHSLVSFRKSIEQKSPQLPFSMAERRSVTWGGASMEVIIGQHGAPKAADELMALSKTLLRSPEDWVLVIEGLPDWRKTGQEILVSDLAIADKISKDKGVPVEDPIPLQGDPEVLERIMKATGLPKEEILAATLIPQFYDHCKITTKVLLARDGKSAKEPPFDVFLKSFLGPARVIYGLSENEARGLIRKTGLRITASEEALQKFFEATVRVRDEMLKARNEVAGDRMRKIVEKYPGKKFLVVFGANHGPVVGVENRDFMKSVTTIDLEELRWFGGVLEGNLRSEIRAKSLPNQARVMARLDQLEKEVSEDVARALEGHAPYENLELATAAFRSFLKDQARKAEMHFEKRPMSFWEAVDAGAYTFAAGVKELFTVGSQRQRGRFSWNLGSLGLEIFDFIFQFNPPLAYRFERKGKIIPAYWPHLRVYWGGAAAIALAAVSAIYFSLGKIPAAGFAIVYAAILGAAWGKGIENGNVYELHELGHVYQFILEERIRKVLAEAGWKEPLAEMSSEMIEQPVEGIQKDKVWDLSLASVQQVVRVLFEDSRREIQSVYAAQKELFARNRSETRQPFQPARLKRSEMRGKGEVAARKLSAETPAVRFTEGMTQAEIDRVMTDFLKTGKLRVETEDYGGLDFFLDEAHDFFRIRMLWAPPSPSEIGHVTRYVQRKGSDRVTGDDLEKSLREMREVLAWKRDAVLEDLQKDVVTNMYGDEDPRIRTTLFEMANWISRAKGVGEHFVNVGFLFREAERQFYERLGGEFRTQYERQDRKNLAAFGVDGLFTIFSPRQVYYFDLFRKKSFHINALAASRDPKPEARAPQRLQTEWRVVPDLDNGYRVPDLEYLRSRGRLWPEKDQTFFFVQKTRIPLIMLPLALQGLTLGSSGVHTIAMSLSGASGLFSNMKYNQPVRRISLLDPAGHVRPVVTELNPRAWGPPDFSAVRKAFEEAFPKETHFSYAEARGKYATELVVLTPKQTLEVLEHPEAFFQSVYREGGQGDLEFNPRSETRQPFQPTRLKWGSLRKAFNVFGVPALFTAAILIFQEEYLALLRGPNAMLAKVALGAVTGFIGIYVPQSYRGTRNWKEIGSWIAVRAFLTGIVTFGWFYPFLQGITDKVWARLALDLGPYTIFFTYVIIHIGVLIEKYVAGNQTKGLNLRERLEYAAFFYPLHMSYWVAVLGLAWPHGAEVTTIASAITSIYSAIVQVGMLKWWMNLEASKRERFLGWYVRPAEKAMHATWTWITGKSKGSEIRTGRGAISEKMRTAEANTIVVNGERLEMKLLSQELFRQYRERIFELFRRMKTDSPQVMSEIDNRLAGERPYDPNLSFAVFDTRGEMVAYSIANETTSSQYAPKTAVYLAMISVAAHYEGTAVSLWLLHRIFLNAENRGYAYAHWRTVRDQNERAVRFYAEKLGAEKLREIPPRKEAVFPDVWHIEYGMDLKAALDKLERLFLARYDKSPVDKVANLPVRPEMPLTPNASMTSRDSLDARSEIREKVSGGVRRSDVQEDARELAAGDAPAGVKDLNAEHPAVLGDIDHNAVGHFARGFDLARLKFDVERVGVAVKRNFHRPLSFLKPVGRYQDDLVLFQSVNGGQNLITEAFVRQTSSRIAYFGPVGAGDGLLHLFGDQLALADSFGGMSSIFNMHNIYDKYGTSDVKPFPLNRSETRELTEAEEQKLEPEFLTAKVFFDQRESWKRSHPDHKIVAIVRHGRSASNEFEYGQSYSLFSPLTLFGRLQAWALARFFKERQIVFDRYLASDLERAFRTVEPSARAAGQKPQIYKRLREIKTDKFGGYMKSLVQGLRDRMFDVFKDSPENFELPGFSGKKLNKYLTLLFHEDIANDPQKTFLIGSHGLTILLAIMNILQIPAAKFRAVYDKLGSPGNVALTVFSYDPMTREWRLLVRADNSYLPAALQWSSKNGVVRSLERLFYWGQIAWRLLSSVFGFRTTNFLSDYQPQPRLWKRPSASDLAAKTEEVDAFVKAHAREAKALQGIIDIQYPKAGLKGLPDQSTPAYLAELGNVALSVKTWEKRSSAPFTEKEMQSFETGVGLTAPQDFLLTKEDVRSVRQTSYDRSSGLIIILMAVEDKKGNTFLLKLLGSDTNSMNIQKRLMPLLSELNDDQAELQISMGNQFDLFGNFTLFSDGKRWNFYAGNSEPWDAAGKTYRVLVEKKDHTRALGTLRLEGDRKTNTISKAFFTPVGDRDQGEVLLDPSETEFVLAAWPLGWGDVPANKLLKEIYTPYADLRHLFAFPYLNRQPLFYDQLVSNPEKLESPKKLDLAFEGKAVDFELVEWVEGQKKILDVASVIEVLTKYGYQHKAYPEQVLKAGDYFISGNSISLILLPAVYPVNALIVGKEGQLAAVFVSGSSGNVGANYWTLFDWVKTEMSDRFSWEPYALLALDNGMDPTWNMNKENRQIKIPKGRDTFSAALLVKPAVVSGRSALILNQTGSSTDGLAAAAPVARAEVPLTPNAPRTSRDSLDARSEMRAPVNMVLRFTQDFYESMENLRDSERESFMHQLHGVLEGVQYTDRTTGVGKALKGLSSGYSEFTWRSALRVIFKYQIFRKQYTANDPRYRNMTLYLHWDKKESSNNQKTLDDAIAASAERVLDPEENPGDAEKVRQLNAWLYGSRPAEATVPEDFPFLEKNLDTLVLSYLQLVTDLKDIGDFIRDNWNVRSRPGQPSALHKAVREMQSALVRASHNDTVDFAKAARYWLEQQGPVVPEVLEKGKKFLIYWFSVEMHLLAIVEASLSFGPVGNAEELALGLAGLYFEIAGPAFRVRIRERIEAWAARQPRTRGGIYAIRMAMKLVRGVNRVYKGEEPFPVSKLDQLARDIARELRKAEIQAAVPALPAPVPVPVLAPVIRPVVPAPEREKPEGFKLPDSPELQAAVEKVKAFLQKQGVSGKFIAAPDTDAKIKAMMDLLLDPKATNGDKQKAVLSSIPSFSRDRVGPLRRVVDEAVLPLIADRIPAEAVVLSLKGIFQTATQAFGQDDLDGVMQTVSFVRAIREKRRKVSQESLLVGEAALEEAFEEAERLADEVSGIRSWISVLFTDANEPQMVLEADLNGLVLLWKGFSQRQQATIRRSLLEEEKRQRLIDRQGMTSFVAAFLLPFLASYQDAQRGGTSFVIDPPGAVKGVNDREYYAGLDRIITASYMTDFTPPQFHPARQRSETRTPPSRLPQSDSVARSELRQGSVKDLLSSLNTGAESSIFQEEVLMEKPLDPDGQAKILRLTDAFRAEVKERGADRHLLAILDAALPRLERDPALQRSVIELADIFRATPGDQPLDNIKIRSNLAFQALIWWVRSWPKRDPHTHVSPSIHSDWQVRYIVAHQKEMELLFKKWKAEIDADLSKPKAKDTVAYREMVYFLGKKGRWTADKETLSAVRALFRDPRLSEKSDALDFMIVTNEGFAESVRHVVRQYFEDGVWEVHLLFNPQKKYSASVDATLQAVHAAIAREEAAADRRWGGTHRVLFDFSFNREKKDSVAVEKAMDELELILKRGAAYAWRLHGFDLSGPELFTGSYYPRREHWQRIIEKARRMGLKVKTHVGDNTNTDLSVPKQLEFFEETLKTVKPEESVSHAKVLAPLIEKIDGRSVRNSAPGEVGRILGELRAKKLKIETTVTDVIFDQREKFRAYFWREQGIPFVPVVDGFRYHQATLSQWIVRLLLAAPENKTKASPLTVQELRAVTSPAPNLVSQSAPGEAPAARAELRAVSRLKEPMVFVIEQARIEGMKSPEQVKLLDWLLGFAAVNKGMLHIVIPDQSRGAEPVWVKDLKQVASVHVNLQRVPRNAGMPVFYFSRASHEFAGEFINRLGSKFSAKSATLVDIDEGRGFVLAALLGRKVEELPTLNGFHRDAVGLYRAELRGAVQALYDNYVVIASAA